MAERKNSVLRWTAFDRFIPFRPNLDVEVSHARLMSHSPEHLENDLLQCKTPASKKYKRLLSETTFTEGRVLPICNTPVTSPFSPRSKQFFPTTPDEGYFSPTVDKPRRITTSPDSIMDIPGLRDDFYTNLLDWSDKNLVATALQQSVYIWNPESKDCQKIEMHLPAENVYFSALSWDRKDKLLAISDNKGEITICDIERMRSERKFASFRQKCSVGALQWTEFGIISGNRRGEIAIHDERCKGNAPVRYMTNGHNNRDVCGLSVSPIPYYLASGGDDGTVNIWDLRMTSDKYTSINAHTACAKALAWCPWKQGVLATGGGSNDGHIRLWYAHTGEKLKEAFTKSQVCGLVWSEDYKELVSALGWAIPDKNDLVVWNMKMFEFEPLAKLRQHMARPLHIALSPDKTTIASAGADEALCLWKTFPRTLRKRKFVPWDRSPLNMFQYIR